MTLGVGGEKAPREIIVHVGDGGRSIAIRLFRKYGELNPPNAKSSAVQPLLGISSVERNGHHYFAGVSFWPADWQTALMEQHGDLYRRGGRGWPQVDVRDGELDLGSVNAAPFGVNFLPDLSGLGRACST